MIIKDIQITARVTEKQRRRIVANAKRCGLSQSEYIKHRALGYEPRALAELERQRDKLGNKIRRPKSPQELEENKARRRELSKQMSPLRKRIKQAERILEQSPHLYELLQHEHELERKAMNRIRERAF